MNETFSQSTEDHLEKKLEGARVFYFRHSKARYDEDKKTLASDNVGSRIDVENQAIDDLMPEGHELAETKAREFFSALDPEADEIFIVSSNITRALQTAAIYARVARELGFRVAHHDNTGSGIALTIGDGYVRSIDSLSLGSENSLQASVFNPPQALPEINWNAVDPETREKWEQARKMVLDDDRGSWGTNFFAHSAEVKAIFPDMQSSENLDEKQFKRLLRLARFAVDKAGGRRIDVLAFGHENYVGRALDRDTGNHALPNCEGVEVRDGKLVRLPIDADGKISL